MPEGKDVFIWSRLAFSDVLLVFATELIFVTKDLFNVNIDGV